VLSSGLSFVRSLLSAQMLAEQGRSLAIRGAALAVALVCGLGVAGLLMAAWYLFLVEPLGAPAAAALTALVLAALAAIAFFVLWRLSERRRKAAQAKAPGSLEEQLPQLVEAARSGIASRPVDAVVVALVAGVVLGASPEARKALRDLLR